jgi:hypothetical protein
MATVREINENDDARFGLKFPLEYNNQQGGFFPTSKTLKEQAFKKLTFNE